MWGGRFAAKPADLMQAINASIDVDQRMWREDIAGSKAHAAMLAAQGIISADDSAKIQAGLDQIAAEIADGRFTFSRDLEDIHFNIEATLTERIGEAGKRLHTGRSRNDQVATDFKLWVRGAVDEALGAVETLQATLLERADEHADWVMPGFTHLQTAQPVVLGHHLLAYVEMLERDQERLAGALERLERDCPLGAAALAGTSFPIDRHMTARALGFERPTANSLDSVSDRDFALETMSAAAICAMHLSRFAEEIVLWATPQFGFAQLSDKFTTGSSIMPQKRNPDAAELVRGKSGRIIAALNGLLIVMKGLPLTYSKDMQEDKEGAFDALQSLSLCIAAMTGMVRDIAPDLKRMKTAAGAGYATATDLADWLVRTLNMPFREAHHVTGRLVAAASAKKIGLEKLTLAEMQAVEPRITDAVYKVLGVDNSVKSRVSYGGTAPANVRAQAKTWAKKLAKEKPAAGV